MDLVDSRTQFKYEFIAGIPLIKSDLETHRESSHQFNTKPIVLPVDVSNNQPIDSTPLEVVGLELNRKANADRSSLHHHHHSHLLMKNGHLTAIDPKMKLSRVDQTVLQLPKRTTFQQNRRTNDHLLPSRGNFTANLLHSSDASIANKTSNGSSNRQLPKQHSDDTSNMAQRTLSNGVATTATPPPLNSSMTILKKLPTNLTTVPESQLSPRILKRSTHSLLNTGREISPIRLPTLLKRTTSTVIKPIPSAYIQESSHSRLPSSHLRNRPILQPTPILPIYTPNRSASFFSDSHHLPIIRDHMVKANLNQRATFKCKSPGPMRPDSGLSRSTAPGPTASQQMKAFNPLKHMDVGSLLSEAARHQLKRLFQQLDSDKDGHLTYPQVQKCLPSNLRRAQQTFFRVLYDLTTDATYFGLQEFYATAMLVDMISKQDSHLWDNLLDDVDFNYYREDILDLLNEFDHHVLSSAVGKINFDHLVTMILHRVHSSKTDQINKALETLYPNVKTTTWTRLEFIALLPAIIYIESSLDHGRTLFRFRENSILDSHMQRHVVI